jgi:lipoate-protein ligase A
MSGWRLVDMPAANAAANMAVDAVLLRQQGTLSPPTLRLYRWSRPALTLGYGLDAESAVNLVGCADAGVDVTRRLTGGGVVLHDGAVTFSIAAGREQVDLPQTSEALHRLGMELALSALAGAGVVARHADGGAAPADDAPNWCPSRIYCHDVLTPGGKIAGGADRRTSRATLYQGYVRVADPSHATMSAAYPADAGPAEPVESPPVDGGAVLAGIALAFAALVGQATRAPLAAQEEQASRDVAETFARPGWVRGDRAEIRRLRRAAESAPPT